MRSISNGKDRQLTVGIDIGSSNIRCAIGSIIPDANRVKLLGISATPSMGFRKGSISHRNQLIEQLEKVLFEAETMADVKVNNAVLAITGNHIRCLNTQAATALNRNRSNGVSGDRAIVETDIDCPADLARPRGDIALRILACLQLGFPPRSHQTERCEFPLLPWARFHVLRQSRGFAT